MPRQMLFPKDVVVDVKPLRMLYPLFSIMADAIAMM